MKRCQCSCNSRKIFWIARIDDVNVLGQARGAVQSRGDSSNEHKADIGSGKRLEQRAEIGHVDRFG